MATRTSTTSTRSRNGGPSLTDFFGRRPLLARVLMRESCVLFFRDLVASGLPIESALTRAAKQFSFSASETSIRRWTRAYQKAGFLGLNENRLGRAGRKPNKNFAPAVPGCGAAANPQTLTNGAIRHRGLVNHLAGRRDNQRRRES